MDKVRAILALQLVIVVLLGVIAYGELTRPAPAPAPVDYATSDQVASLSSQVDSLKQDVASLSSQVDSLKQDVATLSSQVDSLKQDLGSVSDVVQTICENMPSDFPFPC